MSQRFGLIGHHITYSKSPLVHQLIAKYYDLNLTYELLDVQEHQLKDTLVLLKTGVLQGFNVTKPYKEKIISYLDKLTTRAKRIGAVNTISYQNGLLIGDNTDYEGFIGLLEIHQIDVKGKRVYILGNGGAAKAVYNALIDLEANVVVVKRRTSHEDDMFKQVIYYDQLDSKEADIYIQTTTVGTYPDIETSVLNQEQVANQIVVDLIYSPLETKIMKDSQKGVNGLGMLLIQAIQSQSIWQKKALPFSLDLYQQLKEVIKDE